MTTLRERAEEFYAGVAMVRKERSRTHSLGMVAVSAPTSWTSYDNSQITWNDIVKALGSLSTTYTAQ